MSLSSLGIDLQPPVPISDARYLLALRLVALALQEHDRLLPKLQAQAIDWKANHTEVTLLDREIERMWRREIEKSFAYDGIIGEEEGEKCGSNEWRWFLDPIDGTRSLARGVPLYGPMMALERAGEVQWSLIVYPGVGHALTALRNQGVWVKQNLQGPWAKGQLSACSKLSDALVVCSGPEYFANVGKQEIWNQLSHAGLALRTWGDCYGYFLMASARADLLADAVLKPWDLAPVRIIGEELGAKIVDWHWDSGERGLVMGPAQLMAQLEARKLW